MKKRNKIILKLILLIILLGIIFWVVDNNRIKNKKLPMFAVKISEYFDGGSTEYFGLGYKVIKCNTLSGDKSIYLGFYNLDINDVCINIPIDTYNDLFKENIDDREYKINQNLNLNNLSFEQQKEVLGNVIKDKVNSDFILDDYIVMISEPMVNDTVSHIIYDFAFKVGGVKTNIAYTVFVDKERTVVESIFDNTRGYNPQNIKKEYEDIINNKLNNLTEERKENMRKKALFLPEDHQGAKRIVNEYELFDVESKKLYYVFDVEITLIWDKVSEDWKATAANDYKEEI